MNSNLRSKSLVSTSTKQAWWASAVGTVQSPPTFTQITSTTASPPEGCYFLYVDCDQANNGSGSSFGDSGVFQVCGESVDLSQMNPDAVGNTGHQWSGTMANNLSGVWAGPNTIVTVYNNSQSLGSIQVNSSYWNACNSSGWNDTAGAVQLNSPAPQWWTPLIGPLQMPPLFSQITSQTDVPRQGCAFIYVDCNQANNGPGDSFYDQGVFQICASVDLSQMVPDVVSLDNGTQWKGTMANNLSGVWPGPNTMVTVYGATSTLGTHVITAPIWWNSCSNSGWNDNGVAIGIQTFIQSVPSC